MAGKGHERIVIFTEYGDSCAIYASVRFWVSLTCASWPQFDGAEKLELEGSKVDKSGQTRPKDKDHHEEFMKVRTFPLWEPWNLHAHKDSNLIVLKHI